MSVLISKNTLEVYNIYFVNPLCSHVLKMYLKKPGKFFLRCLSLADTYIKLPFLAISDRYRV